LGHARASNRPKREGGERRREREREREREIHFNLVFFHAITRALATLLARGFPEKVKRGKRYASRDEEEKEKGEEKCVC